MALFASAAKGATDENIVAIGNVLFNGDLISSANTVGGIVTSNSPGTGHYFVNINAAGAFAGAAPEDFIVHSTIRALTHTDVLVAASVNDLNPNSLKLEFWVADVEDNTFPGSPELRDFDFAFTVHRAPLSGEMSASSRYLISTGQVAINGSLQSAAAVDDIQVQSYQITTGEYGLLLSKPGGFKNDSPMRYVIIATRHSSSYQDEIARAYAVETNDDNEALIKFMFDDVQDSSDDDNGFANDADFQYSIYEVPAPGQPDRVLSELNVALVSVGIAGGKVRGNCALPGATISTVPDSTGHYYIYISSPGAFAGLTVYDFVMHLTPNLAAICDETAAGRVQSVTDSTITISVNTDDVENAGTNTGDPTDRAFYLLLQSTNGKAISDNLIGRKRALTKMKGNNVYNASGAGQKIVARAKGPKGKFFFSVQNDGNVSASSTIRRKGKVKGVKAKFFRLSGGRQNVTAKILTSGYKASNMAPGASVVFKAKTKFTGTEKQDGMVRLMTAGTNDVCVARIKGE